MRIEHLKEMIEILKAERSRPVHKPGSAPDERQRGELNAFNMVLRMIETGEYPY